MAIRFTKFCGRATLIAVEGLAVIVGLFALGLGLLIWRVNSGPLDVTFAKDYVQESMHDPASGYSIEMGHVTTSWPDLKGPLLLRLQNVNLLKHGRTVLHVGMVDISLSKAQLLLGQVAPQGVILTNPSLRLLRSAQNNIVLSLQDEVPDVTSADGEDNALMNIIHTLAKPEGTIDRRSPFDRLKTLEIRDARMVMEDHVLGMTWFLPDADFVFLRDRQGLVLTAGMALPGTAEAPSKITADIAYNRERDDIVVNLDLENVAPRMLAGKIAALDFLDTHDLTVTGEARARLDAGMKLLDVTADLSAAPGSLSLPGLYDQPLAFDYINFSGRYDRATQTLEIGNAGIKIGAVQADVTAGLAVTPEKIEGTVNLSVPELPQAAIAPLWPSAARDESAAQWLTQKMTGGRFHDIAASFTLKGAPVAGEDGRAAWSFDAADIRGDIALSDMDVDYRAPLPALKKASARGRFENDTLTIEISKGRMGGLAVEKGTVRLTELIHGDPGGVSIAADIRGPLDAVFDYIAHEPINMGSGDLGFDAASARGDAQLQADISFPALRDLPAERVKVGVTGTLRDTYLPGVVKNLALSGGPLALAVDDQFVSLSGKAKLDNRDVQLSWRQYLESKGKPWSSQVEASMIADRDLRHKLGIALDDWIDGAVPVSVTYTEYGGGRAEAAVRADINTGRLTVKPFGYEKPPGIRGSASARVLLQGGYLQEVQDLAVQTPDLNLEKARLVFRTERGESVLRQGTFPRATLGENDIGLKLDVITPDQYKLDVTGAVFDARPFLNKGGDGKASPAAPYTGPAILATINVGRMRTHPGRMVEKAKVYLDMSKAGDIRRLEMDAVAGKGMVFLRLRPDPAGKMTVRLEAQDAGAAMSSFGVYDNVRGGKLLIVGEATAPEKPRMLYGTVQLTDFNAVNAPILARLVSAISPMGIAELLASDGIYFERLESKFDWHMRREGDLYVVTGGRTSGSSLGLTFAGKIDKAARRIDIDGHIVPVSMINSLLSSIPLVGSILSGGSDGGVFAATYTVSGPQDAPTVSVNPLSVLAPGIIRRILFESD